MDPWYETMNKNNKAARDEKDDGGDDGYEYTTSTYTLMEDDDEDDNDNDEDDWETRTVITNWSPGDGRMINGIRKKKKRVRN